jgi:hypothetical protein
VSAEPCIPVWQRDIHDQGASRSGLPLRFLSLGPILIQLGYRDEVHQHRSETSLLDLRVIVRLVIATVTNEG